MVTAIVFIRTDVDAVNAVAETIAALDGVAHGLGPQAGLLGHAGEAGVDLRQQGLHIAERGAGRRQTGLHMLDRALAGLLDQGGGLLDHPAGGGAGMVLKPDVLAAAIDRLLARVT